MVEEIRQNIVLSVTARGIDKARTAMETLTDDNEDLTRGLEKQTTITKRSNDTTGKMATNIRTKYAPAVKHFKFEFLGLMFAGQAVASAFGSITSAGFKVYQIGKLIDVVSAYVMIPAMDKIYGVVEDVADKFLDLDDNGRLAIGALALLGQSAGIALGFVSQLSLALVSLNMAGGLSGVLNTAQGLGSKIVGAVGKAISIPINFVSSGLALIETKLAAIGLTGAALVAGTVLFTFAITFVLGKFLGVDTPEAFGQAIISGIVAGAIIAMGGGFALAAGAGIVLTLSFVLGNFFGKSDAAGAASMLMTLFSGAIAAALGLGTTIAAGVGFVFPIAFSLAKIFGYSDPKAAGIGLISLLLLGIGVALGAPISLTAGAVAIGLAFLLDKVLGLGWLTETIGGALLAIVDWFWGVLMDVVGFLGFKSEKKVNKFSSKNISKKKVLDQNFANASSTQNYVTNTVNVSAKVDSDIDIDRLADRVSSKLKDDFRRSI